MLRAKLLDFALIKSLFLLSIEIEADHTYVPVTTLTRGKFKFHLFVFTSELAGERARSSGEL